MAVSRRRFCKSGISCPSPRVDDIRITGTGGKEEGGKEEPKGWKGVGCARGVCLCRGPQALGGKRSRNEGAMRKAHPEQGSGFEEGTSGKEFGTEAANGGGERRNQNGRGIRGCDDDLAESTDRGGELEIGAPAMIQIAARTLGSAGGVPVSQPRGAQVSTCPHFPLVAGRPGLSVQSSAARVRSRQRREFRNDLTASPQRAYVHAPGVPRKTLPPITREQGPHNRLEG